MLKFSNRFALVMVLLFFSSLCVLDAHAQRRRSSGGFGSSSSSKYSSPSSNKSSSKYSSPSSNKSGKTSSPTGKPSASNDSRAKASQVATSKRTYVETKKATAPPKSSYKTSDGKNVKVRTDSLQVKSIRSKPSTHYTPSVRQERATTHITNHNYAHDYGWYQSQPRYYIGGGYSSSFWWMMSEWSAERRARWLYHNQNTIDQNAYQRGLQDAAVAAQIQQLKSENLPINADYVDSELANDPSIMYSQDYIEAAYNPTVASNPPGSALNVLIWLIVICIAAYVIYLISTKVKFGT